MKVNNLLQIDELWDYWFNKSPSMQFFFYMTTEGMPYTYCQDFDLVWILFNANLIPNISLLFHHYEPAKYLRVLDVTGILVLWYLLYQIWSKICKIHKAMKAKQFKTRQKTLRIAESHSNKIGESWYSNTLNSALFGTQNLGHYSKKALIKVTVI